MSEREGLLEDSDQESVPQEVDHEVNLRKTGNVQSDGTSTQPTEEESDQKTEALIQPDPKRWYLLFLFSSVSLMQGMVWNTWGPISDSAEFAFHWDNATIATMSNWGPIAYILVAFLFAWLMDVKGLRVASLLTAVTVAVGTGIRCLMAVTTDTGLITVFMHIGQLFNGVGGPVSMGGPPVFSAVWFPVHQRTTATAIAASLNGLGVSIAYIIAPLLVPDVRNLSDCKNASSEEYKISNCTEQRHTIIRQIELLMYIEFAASALALILMLIYFPAKPKISPSITASQGRIDFRKGAVDLLRNKRLWLLAMVYSISGGVYGGWSSILDVILKPHNISETTAGWIGFWSSVAAQVSGLVVGFFADLFAKKMKLFATVMYSIAALVILVLALECTGIIPISIASVYVLIILSGVCLLGTIPLFFELGCETAYPVAEGLTNSWMTWWNNVFGLVFLLVPLIPNIGTVWMNWCLAGSIAVCIPAFFFYKEGYTRYDIDVRDEM